jgi:hypothetical protein
MSMNYLHFKKMFLASDVVDNFLTLLFHILELLASRCYPEFAGMVS